MGVDADPPGVHGLINPYRSAAADEVRGASLARWGLAAGVIAMAASVDAASGALPGGTQIRLVTGPSVSPLAAAASPTAGYLWPAPPEDGDLPVSPALGG